MTTPYLNIYGALEAMQSDLTGTEVLLRVPNENTVLLYPPRIVALDKAYPHLFDCIRAKPASPTSDPLDVEPRDSIAAAGAVVRTSGQRWRAAVTTAEKRAALAALEEAAHTLASAAAAQINSLEAF